MGKSAVLVMKETMTYINRVRVKDNGTKVLDTWIKYQSHNGFWECDIMTLQKGNAHNQESLEMDANLKACYEFYKDKDFYELENLEEFEVKVECLLDGRDVVEALAVTHHIQ